MTIAKCAGFYIMLKIRRRVGARLDCLLWTIEKRQVDDTNLARLVDGKAQDLEDDVLQLAAEKHLWGDVLEEVDRAYGREVAKKTEGAIYRYVMRAVANFHRRIVDRVEAWPCKLLKLAMAPPNQPCQTRAKLCAAILVFEKKKKRGVST